MYLFCAIAQSADCAASDQSRSCSQSADRQIAQHNLQIVQISRLYKLGDFAEYIDVLISGMASYAKEFQVIPLQYGQVPPELWRKPQSQVWLLKQGRRESPQHACMCAHVCMCVCVCVHVCVYVIGFWVSLFSISLLRFLLSTVSVRFDI